MKIQASLLVRKISIRPDVVWSFHGYLFGDLKLFGAPVNIFFAADQFFYEEIPPEIGSADLTLAVSDTIFNRIGQSGKKVFQINHGLQKQFVSGAQELLKHELTAKPVRNIVAGYTGNLRMEALDRVTMMAVIKGNPDIKFIFWGSYKKKDLNLGGLQDKEADAFIDFLEKSPNVDLTGSGKERTIATGNERS